MPGSPHGTAVSWGVSWGCTVSEASCTVSRGPMFVGEWLGIELSALNVECFDPNGCFCFLKEETITSRQDPNLVMERDLLCMGHSHFFVMGLSSSPTGFLPSFPPPFQTFPPFTCLKVCGDHCGLAWELHCPQWNMLSRDGWDGHTATLLSPAMAILGLFLCPLA